MKISKAGIDLIIEAEGCVLKAYPDPGSVDGNPWTIGIGTTRMDGKPIAPGTRITKQKAIELLQADLEEVEYELLECLKPKTPTQEQFDAMVSLVYNIGISKFKKSTVRRKFLAGDLEGAAEAFKMWNKNDGKVLAGLVVRRGKEAALFASSIAVSAPVIANNVTPKQEASIVPDEPAEQKPLFKSKEIVSGVGLGATGITSLVSQISIDDVVNAKSQIATVQSTVKEQDHLPLKEAILTGCGILTFVLAVVIVLNRILARKRGER